MTQNDFGEALMVEHGRDCCFVSLTRVIKERDRVIGEARTGGARTLDLLLTRISSLLYLSLLLFIFLY